MPPKAMQMASVCDIVNVSANQNGERGGGGGGGWMGGACAPAAL